MKCRITTLIVSCSLVLVALASGCSNQPQASFDSPEQATDSLVSALRANNRKQLKHILGSDSDELISSGDDVADRQGIATFLEQYDTKHSLVQDEQGRRTIVVGQEEWPMPIPIIRDNDDWYFDTPAGMDEVINRRVGRNELSSMQVCRAVVDAQREYALEDRDANGIQNYAAKFRSDPGKKNGLFWPTAENERPSPLGPLVIRAVEEGYTAPSRFFGKPAAYHGYRFHMLTSQGPNAPGGAQDYLIHSEMLGGFAVVAYPAQYGASGVKTFIISQDDVLYERDLGEETEAIASKMNTFDPGVGWSRVEHPAP